MAKVVIYTKPYCPYCVRALALLERKGADVEEIEAAFDPEKKAEMIQRANSGACSCRSPCLNFRIRSREASS